jgi:DNA-binding MarR family transcriptional regulator
MSRDRHLEVPHEHVGRTAASGGRELPRGGRGGTATRRQAQSFGRVRDALAQQLDLPRGDGRERVCVGSKSYELRASEVRLLAAVGAFRVADARDVGAAGDGELKRLRQAGLVEVLPHQLNGQRASLVSLTADGRAVVQHYQRISDGEPRQAYYAGVVKPREVTHDAQLYRAYATAAERLQSTGNSVRRVLLDYELKREYQRFLQENNRTHRRSSGRPDRSPEEIRAWAAAHDLPVVNGRVQFPDVRVEYERPDGERAHEDLELATGHYNSRQMAAKRASGFTLHHSRGSHIRGANSRGGAAPFDPHAAEGVLG